MDLQDTPTMQPIASETLVIKPENQKDIKRDNQNRNVRFLIPNYVGYYLPDQSNFSCEITMEGRGNPIPSRDAGIHSLFNVVRTHDGTNSHILEEVLQYNTLVAQQFHYTKTNSLDNYRTEFEGVQPNKSIDGNIYWKPATGSAYPNANVVAPDVANPVQVVFPLKTEFYSSSEFIPATIFNGLRLELQMEDYRRALEFTTGSLGVGSANGLCPNPLAIIQSQNKGSAGGDPQKNQFSVGVVGAGYDITKIYTVTDAGGILRGYVQPTAVNAGDNALVNGEVLFYALGPNTTLPDAGTVLDVGVPSAGGSGGNVAGQITVTAGVIPMGAIRIEDHNSEFFVELGVGRPSTALAGTTSPATRLTDFGAGTLRDPFRVVNPIGTNGSGYGIDVCFPDCVMPFSVGDRLKMNTLTNAGEVTLGVITEIQKSGSNCRILFAPDIAVVTGLGNDVAVAGLAGGTAGILAQDYLFSNLEQGYKLFVEEADRLNGYTFTNISGRAKAPTQAVLVASASSKVDFTVKNLQYQIKRVDMDDSTVQADLRASNSSSGYKLDIPTTQTRLVNLQAIQGPTSQLISIPNITKALGVLSVPLNQNEQFSLAKESLKGRPDGMSNYQYELGHDGLQPQRKVPIDKASLGNPLVQTQALNELIKANEAFGYSTMNLNMLGLNFAVGRQFARNDMYYNLMEAGDLTLRADYDSGQTFPKLFAHFIHHLRTIVVSSSGIQMSN